jgi:hypothetical protein
MTDLRTELRGLVTIWRHSPEVGDYRVAQDQCAEDVEALLAKVKTPASAEELQQRIVSLLEADLARWQFDGHHALTDRIVAAVMDYVAAQSAPAAESQ